MLKKYINFHWNLLLKNEYHKPYFIKLLKTLKIEYNRFTCFPKQENIFSCLKYCSFNKLKVVIIGQDPYYKENQADGLCFSIPDGITLPPSLRNIFTEVNSNFHNNLRPTSGSLIHWAEQGVLLLNSILTVRKDNPLSHKNIGWEFFTDQIIRIISDRKKNIVFLLWGKYAQKKISLINFNHNHYVLKTSHPSPFSAHMGFFGSKHFEKTNNFLKKIGKETIFWC
ncbi:uracil-DNA glycosylase [Blattabacterium sp. (Blaberus giganteus)]|uniref:uracil-DNA glycosylase n=1 Tax=Blattabacterium sp. (Blaberus giganteus) TaxID=1186051 RepID=UPI00025F6FE7|nr:uracil-DNA glycosylase [Blattabacterium sp. (Blaberus giganteus)]AFJ90910.1 uracil-DNA glycosylase [Blattabacterium sp. (Blaberus giganteus)]